MQYQWSLIARKVTDSDRYPSWNPNQPALMFTAVITNLARADRKVIIIHQFRLHVSIRIRYILFFFSKEKGGQILNPQTHSITLTVSLC